MASVINIIGKIFGSKADRDLKQLTPNVDKILREYERIDKLDHDRLRGETEKVRQIIRDYIAEDEKAKAALREQLEDVEIEVEKKEELATEVDKLTKKIDEKIEEIQPGSSGCLCHNEIHCQTVQGKQNHYRNGNRF